MIKPLLLSGFMSLFAVSALAQAPVTNLESETFKQRLRSQYLQNDTAQAVINLYSKRQAGGASWIVGSALTALRIVTASGRQTDIGGGYVIQEEAPSPAAALVVLPLVAYGIGKMVHYSNSNLEKTVTAYGAGQPLPRNVRRKLKPRFFDQPIIQYKPVEVKPAN
ncbi:hypothetical protein [Hymenobacter sp. BT730]|uniref:hypothetical protein n=1 Tax=Hymenobacter sp. BT730 TaxID=3063332 RepID=UPI0026E05073|nr:hypothetical protein [Hymenobacter sp. BT730]